MDYKDREERYATNFLSVGDAPLLAERSNQLPLSNQEKEIAVLQQTIDELAERLHLVLSPEMTTGLNSSPGNEQKAPASPLAEQLCSNNRAISNASSRLRSLMARLEC